MAARSRKVELTAEWRSRIQTSMILNRLQDHLSGKVELKTTQVKAAEILLRKTIPDLSATTISGDPDNPVVGIADALSALLQRPAIAALRARVADEAGDTIQ
jgi:hypothetical protein